MILQRTILVCLLAASGCASDVPPALPPDAPHPVGHTATQIVALVPPLKSQRFSILLDFEADSDAMFIGSHPQGRIVYDRAHTGSRSVRFDSKSTRIVIKLGSVLSGRAFPADWTLLGLFLYSEQPVEVKLALESSTINVTPRSISLGANVWTNALLDISGPKNRSDEELHALAPADATLVLTLPANHPPIWCDDVLLIDNAEELVSAEPAQPTTAPASTSPIVAAEPSWSVERRGLNYVGAAPGKFNFKLLTSDATAGGWKIEEANALRARFSSDGATKHLTVYSDGRSYWDSVLKPMSAQARDESAFAEQHDSPAEIVVPPELGRVNRDTPGDANNDGYNEQRGAYELIATGARLELKIIPHTRWVATPVLEVSGLPAGPVLVTVEGRLVEKSVRLDDGTLLVELPVKLDRPTTINLRVQ